MSYFSDVLVDITEGIEKIADLCGYHEEPDDADAYDYYGSLICDAEDQSQTVRYAIARIMCAAYFRGYDWVDGQAEICRQIVADMTDGGMLCDETDRFLEYACQDHCW